MSRTDNLKLPFLLPGQAQKHITHNEALKMLDALTQITVQTVISALPPDATSGQCFLVDANAGGDLINHRNKLAQFYENAWSYYTPQTGWRAWRIDALELIIFDGADWSPLSQVETSNFSKIGINTTPDDVNRLAIKSSYSLFDADADGHRVKINKSAPAASSSLIFQSQYAGHAEIGLTGDNDFHLKVSSNGTSWSDALKVERDTGIVEAQNGLRFATSRDLLDIYETGTWTPTLFGSDTAGAPSYNVAQGEYVRIGCLVFVSCRIGWLSLGGAAGRMSVGGLPFDVASGYSNRAAINISWYNSLSMGSTVTWLGGFGVPGDDYVTLWGADTPNLDSNNLLSAADLSESAELYFTMTYRT